MYLQLYNAVEALVHVYRDGCRTTGPSDKMLKGRQADCGSTARKGLENLVHHFSGCKTQVTGGCKRCKSMRKIIKLHSRMCNDPDFCKVPLCR